MAVVAGAPISYRQYSYRDRADVYEAPLEPASVERVRAAAGLLRYATLREQVRGQSYSAVELFARR
jgi:hypothetical protein